MIKGVKAMNEEIKTETNYEYWIIIVWLSLILLCVYVSNHRQIL